MNTFLHRIAGLCLLGMVLDLALPEGDARGFAELGVGLSMMLCMLNMLVLLLRGGL